MMNPTPTTAQVIIWNTEQSHAKQNIKRVNLQQHQKRRKLQSLITRLRWAAGKIIYLNSCNGLRSSVSTVMVIAAPAVNGCSCRYRYRIARSLIANLYMLHIYWNSSLQNYDPKKAVTPPSFQAWIRGAWVPFTNHKVYNCWVYNQSNEEHILHSGSDWVHHKLANTIIPFSYCCKYKSHDSTGAKLTTLNNVTCRTATLI